MAAVLPLCAVFTKTEAAFLYFHHHTCARPPLSRKLVPKKRAKSAYFFTLLRQSGQFPPPVCSLRPAAKLPRARRLPHRPFLPARKPGAARVARRPAAAPAVVIFLQSIYKSDKLYSRLAPILKSVRRRTKDLRMNPNTIRRDARGCPFWPAVQAGQDQMPTLNFCCPPCAGRRRAGRSRQPTPRLRAVLIHRFSPFSPFSSFLLFSSFSLFSLNRREAATITK